MRPGDPIPNTSAPAAGKGLTLDLSGYVPSVALIERWHEVGTRGEPAFTNSWVNFGGTQATAAFCKDAAGIVYLKGVVKSGSVGSLTPAFTLPEGYRPSGFIGFAVPSNNLFGQLDVNTNGTVACAVGSNLSFNLNVSFRAA